MIKIKSKRIKFLMVFILILSSILPAFGAYAAIEVSASALSDTQIRLQWSWAMGAVNCRIYRDGATAPIKTVNINTDSEYTSFTDSGLMPETQYSYRIEMEDVKGNRIDRADVSTKTLGISKPVIISAVFDIAASAVNEHSITIKWRNSSSNISGALIERADGTDIVTLDKLSDYTVGDIVTYTFKDKITVYNQMLNYTVTVTDSQGRKSQPSSPVNVIPIKPPVISASMNSGNVVVSWSDSTAIEHFQLERSKYDITAWGNWAAINASILPGTSSLSDIPEASGSYRYRLSAIPGGRYTGTGNISEPVQKLLPPSNLVCSYVDTDKVSLTWTNDANNKGIIKIEKRIGQGSFTEIATLARSISSYTDVGVFLPNQSYYYRVIAYDTDDNKAVSNTSSVSLSEPSAPAGLKVTVVSNRNLLLTWEDRSDNETSFIIERKTGSGSYAEIGTTKANIIQYNDPAVSSSETYSYRVRAANSFGNSVSYSNEVTAVAYSYSSPDSLSLKAVSPSQIDISWTYSGTGNVKTVIERGNSAGKEWRVIAEVPAEVRSYSDTGLSENTLYCYRVRALISENVYSEYYPGGIQSYAAYTKLAVPSGLTATVSDESKIELIWNDNSSETNFIIQRKEGSGSYYVTASVPANTKSWTDHSTTAGKTYTYRVQARTDKNESDISEELTITATRILSPTQLAVEEDNNSSVKMTWKDNSDNESGFEIWRRTDITGTWEKHDTVGAGTTSYTDGDAVPDISYFYKVRAYISQNSAISAFSNEVEKTVLKLEAPADFTATAISSAQIRLDWAGSYSANTEFTIERKKAGGVYAEIAHNITAQGRYMDNGLEPASQYSYRIKASEKGTFSEYSREAAATTKPKVEFKDLSSVSWAKTAIENMASRGIINGMGGGSFAPNSTMTKAQFVCILIRSFDLGDYSSSAGFSDVTSGRWYYKELMAAKALGIIVPDESNYFYPEEPITREDMAVFISRTLAVAGKQLEKVDTGILDTFTDKASISDYALQSVADLFKAEIMVGNGNGTLAPKSTATRAQAAVIISRIIDR